MIDLTFVFRSLKGRCYGNRFSVTAALIGIPELHAFALSVHNEFCDRNADARVNTGDDLSTSCRNVGELRSRLRA